MTHEAIRKALEILPAECRKPWRQLDGLPYLHATEDENAKPWGTPVVGRFDYLETMTYIAACNPEAITALLADRDRLAAEVEALRKDAWRLDWLENRIAEEGELHLHDGNHPRGMGLGLFFGKLNQRTLRQAIDVAMPPTASPEEGTS